jgi:SWI/SNF-related matrix-associated actin-dependent regulator 1 of chromatin subfamily A
MPNAGRGEIALAGAATLAIAATEHPILVAAYRAEPVSVSMSEHVSLSASLAGGEAVLRFPYDERLRKLLRAIPGRRWDPVERVWCLPLDPPDRAEALARLLEGLPGAPHVSEELARTLARRRARRHRGECLVDLARPDAHWWLGFATDTAPELVQALLEHPGAHTLPAIGRALMPLDEDAAQMIETLREANERLRLSPPAQRALVSHRRQVAREHRATRTRPVLTPAINTDPFAVDELDALLAEHDVRISDRMEPPRALRERHAREAELVALSAATDGTLEVAGLGGELKPFQRAGVSYLLTQRRAFLADEQGLGKTIEALATLEADGAYPAVVVCPASLKLNWLRELRHWLPHRSARALIGTRVGSGARGGNDAWAVSGARAGTHGAPADVTVVNYDIVASRLEELRSLAPRALVLDESHYCKNAKAKRTRAVLQLATAVPQEGLVLALTGTPVMNHPKELISQLRILGRLGEFGSGMRFSRDFHGPGAHQRLHWHLRARCFARRLKRDVLPQLPPKTRAVVPVEFDNEAEYRLAERDLVAWLQSQPLDLDELDAKVAAALRAERLVRLNALKLLAARGKLHAALAWIHDFCTSGERLVVFAHHREIQRAVLERFPSALHLLGEDSHIARDASWHAFQAPDSAGNQLLVCSIEVAGQGVTLTRSSNVVFLELDWTPAKHDQAEDRCHRIGQRDAVNATYLLAAGTIDETIATLLERKRAVIGAVTDGRPEDEEGVVDALVRELRGTPYRHLRAVA